MKIENQVCTLEQAKKLKELGVAQNDAYFYWDKLPMDKEIKLHQFYDVIDLSREGDELPKDAFAAFTVAELGVIFPNNVGDYIFTSERTTAGWYIGYHSLHCSYAPTEAEARAGALIHLIENKLISIEEVNQRLSDS